MLQCCLILKLSVYSDYKIQLERGQGACLSGVLFCGEGCCCNKAHAGLLS